MSQLLLLVLLSIALHSCLPSQVRLALAGKGPLNAECYQHPGRKGCKVEKLLAEV